MPEPPELHLVSGARPLKKPAKYERDLLNAVHKWIEGEVLGDAQRKRPAHSIDERRTGRVLLIDGPRGAGKTSFLLTMLQCWDRKARGLAVTAPEESAGDDNRWTRTIPHLQVLFPVLDFDPLPRHMPIHAWLLEPWRLFLRTSQVDGSNHHGDEEGSLEEQLATLVEKAILGFTPVRPDAGAVAKALAYRDQASGLLDTQPEWRRFIDAVVCRVNGCHDRECKGGHRHIFLVPIDDVDLQIEHIPSLLHAVRLLWHPNVLYVLTGDLKHLRAVLDLDFTAQHQRLLERGSLPRDQIEHYVPLLREALVEKVLAKHTSVLLRPLRSEEILAYEVESSAARTDGRARLIRDLLSPGWSDLLAQPGIASREISTARRMEHMVDTYLRDATERRDQGASARFVTNLCSISDDVANDDREFPRVPRGRLETTLGHSRRELEGDRLSLVIADPPLLRFFLASSAQEAAPPQLPEYANNAAFLMQLAIETPEPVAAGAEAPAGVRPMLLKADTSFVWQPVAGFVAVRSAWDSNVKHVGNTALFHWPWLVRPWARQFVTFEDAISTIVATLGDNSLRNLSVSTPLEWVKTNIVWWKQQREWRGLPPAAPNQDHEGQDLDERYRQVALDLRGIRALDAEEVDRWLGELAVMSAPYMGLPTEAGQVIRELVNGVVDVKDRMRRERTELTVVRDALVAGSPHSQAGPSDFMRAAELFIKQRRERKRADPWWTWLDLA